MVNAFASRLTVFAFAAMVVAAPACGSHHSALSTYTQHPALIPFVKVKHAFEEASGGDRFSFTATHGGPGTFSFGKGVLPSYSIDPWDHSWQYQVQVFDSVAKAQRAQALMPPRDPLSGVREATLRKLNVLIRYRVGTARIETIRHALAQL
jgi:hypothetical protein